MLEILFLKRLDMCRKGLSASKFASRLVEPHVVSKLIILVFFRIDEPDSKELLLPINAK